MDLGVKIKNRRMELDLTLEHVGKMVGVSKSTVMKWETGYIENMKRDKIVLLAKALQVSPLWLMDMEEEKDNSFVKEEPVPYNTHPFKRIPIVGQIAAGTPILAEENVEDYFSVDSRLKADFALKVKGDSMIDAGIFEDDIVFIRQQCTLENGEIGAILVEGEATLKRFFKDSGNIILQSENKSYPPMVFSNGNIKVLGKLSAVLNIVK